MKHSTIDGKAMHCKGATDMYPQVPLSVSVSLRYHSDPFPSQPRPPAAAAPRSLLPRRNISVYVKPAVGLSRTGASEGTELADCTWDAGPATEMLFFLLV